MAVFVRDSFETPGSSADLETHTADILGGQWDAHSSTFDDIRIIGANAGLIRQRSTVSTITVYYNPATPPSNDYTSELTATSGAAGWGAVVRRNSTTNGGYVGLIFPNGASRLYRLTGSNTYTQIASGASGDTVTYPVKIAVQVSGTDAGETIDLLRDGVSILNVTADGTFDSGDAGLVMQYQSGTPRATYFYAGEEYPDPGVEGADVSPLGKQNLEQQFSVIAASGINGVLQQ